MLHLDILTEGGFSKNRKLAGAIELLDYTKRTHHEEFKFIQESRKEKIEPGKLVVLIELAKLLNLDPAIAIVESLCTLTDTFMERVGPKLSAFCEEHIRSKVSCDAKALELVTACKMYLSDDIRLYSYCLYQGQIRRHCTGDKVKYDSIIDIMVVDGEPNHELALLGVEDVLDQVEKACQAYEKRLI